MQEAENDVAEAEALVRRHAGAKDSQAISKTRERIADRERPSRVPWRDTTMHTDPAHGPGGAQFARGCENTAAEQAAGLQGAHLLSPPFAASAKAVSMCFLQTNVANLKATVKKAGAALMDLEGARDELLSRAEAGDTAGGPASSAAQRDRLLSAQDKLKQTGDRIKEGKKTLLETEELGVSILQDLHKQRETITHTRDTLHGADENIGRSRRILTSMARRAMQNKIMLGVTIVMLLLAIIAIAAAQHKKNSNNGR